MIDIIAGSKSDEKIVNKVISVLDDNGVEYKIHYLSAHRNHDELVQHVRNSSAKVFICIAGLSAALPGVVASLTNKPVIGVPVSAPYGTTYSPVLNLNELSEIDLLSPTNDGSATT